MRATSVAALVSVLAIASVTGCPGPEPQARPLGEGGASGCNCPGQVCDAAGACVECNESPDCPANQLCDKASHTCAGAGCFDNDKNGSETDIDCGGDCPGCDADEDCLVGDDCKSKLCEPMFFTCLESSCFDGIQNGDETGKDCGGSCKACSSAECTGPGQCASHFCNSQGECAPCSGPGDCAFDEFCSSAKECVPLKQDGASCDGDGQCESDLCVDDVCCDKGCHGFCEACSAAKKGAGADGVCEAITTGLDPDAECTLACDGAGSCIPGKGVFVTDEEFPATFGSAAGADDECKDAAAAADLAGTWKAWMTDASATAATRLAHAVVPYRLLDGTLVANDWTDLTDGTLANPINITETGVILGAAEVWTGTATDGTNAGVTCASWTDGTDTVNGHVGLTNATDFRWTTVYQQKCDRIVRLYCFEQ